MTKVFSKELIQTYAPVTGIIFGLITAIVAVATYRETANKDLEARNFEAQKPFFEKQMEFYIDAVETVSKIATGVSPDKADVDHFWKIYWGRLAAVEDTSVDRAMVIFGGKLNNEKSSTHCLRQSSLLLAHCIKRSWADSWRVTLAPPPELQCDESSFEAVAKCI